MSDSTNQARAGCARLCVFEKVENSLALRQESLLLIDALALAYRAYHAIPPLSAKDGTPTNAVLGFVKAVRQLKERFNPTLWAAVFDGGLPAERMIKLPTYKAQRPPMPDTLARQLALIDEYLDAESIPRIRLDGTEADDVMATLATEAERNGFRVRIATNDKDLYQIVSEKTTIVAPVKDAPELGPDEIRLKTGVPPDRIPDWLALVGDDADNIPGVPGIGPKTAARLIQEFGGVEGLLNRLEEVANEKWRISLKAAEHDIRRNLEIVNLRRDLQGLPGVDSLAIREADSARLRSFFERLGMSSLAPANPSTQLSLF